MAKLRSKWDGTVRRWMFGEPGRTKTWDVEAVSLARAVRMFRVGCRS